MGIINDLLPAIDGILGIRDAVGATLHPVYLVTRTWSGTQPGDGTAVDVSVLMTPSPATRDFSHKFANLTGGQYQQGDLMLVGISKNSYPSEDVVTCKSTQANVERFYMINSKLYQVISFKENYVTWDVQIRKLAHDTRY